MMQLSCYVVGKALKLHAAWSSYCVVGYGHRYLGCGCGGWHVPTTRTQRSSDAGEVHAEMQCAHKQVC